MSILIGNCSRRIVASSPPKKVSADVNALKVGRFLSISVSFSSSCWLLVVLLIVAPLGCDLTKVDPFTIEIATDSCQFPAAWSGSWFQKGVQEPIRIFNGTISNKGDCRKVEGDKFLIESRSERCHRCVVIHAKHTNVLQYKETYCSQIYSLQSVDALCGEINGDALLFSMFRLNSPPVTCPFHGPFSFTYSRGQGHLDCGHPVSSVEACTVDSRLLFRFQACADVPGSESRVEELVCLAAWKEGSTRYFVGKLEHKMAKTDEDKLRCFVYEKEKEKDHPGVLLAQSGDATCDGLFSATEGSRTMKLTKVTHPHAKCHFPEWMTSHKHWKTLDNSQSYQFSQRNNTFKIINSTDTDEKLELRIVCTQEESSMDGLVQLVVHSTSGCKSGYMCMKIHRRNSHVIEVQLGSQVAHASDACSSYNFDPLKATFLTLTSGIPDPRVCPLIGIYSLDGSHPQLIPILSPEASHHHRGHHTVAVDPNMGAPAGLTGANRCHAKSTVTAGCDAADKIEFLAECASDTRMRAFQCHGSWEENGTFFLIASAVGSRKRYCMTFTENEKVMQFSGSQDSCVRNVPYFNRDFITFNVTSKGMCRTTNTASALHINLWTVLLVICATCLGFPFAWCSNR